MTMGPLYPRGKPCSRGTHNETVRKQDLFSSIINYDGTTASNLNLMGVFSILQSNRNIYRIYIVTIVIDDYPKDGGEELFTKMHCVL